MTSRVSMADVSGGQIVRTALPRSGGSSPGEGGMPFFYILHDAVVVNCNNGPTVENPCRRPSIWAVYVG